MAERKARRAKHGRSTTGAAGNSADGRLPAGHGDQKALPPATAPSAWATAGAEIIAVELPSGNTVHVRQVDLLDLLAQGHIPDSLTGSVVKVVEISQGKAKAKPKPEDMADILSTYMPVVSDMYALTGAICKAVLVSPRVVEDPTQEEGITLEMLDLPDRLMIFGAISGGGEAALAPFREEPQGDVGPVLAGEDVGEPAE